MAGLNLVVALCLANLLTGSAGAPTPASHNRTVQLQFITIEEHYDLEIMIPYQTGPVIELLGQALGNATAPLIGNINGSRLHSMDANGIRVQVLFLLSSLSKCTASWSSYFLNVGNLERSHSTSSRQAHGCTSSE